MRKNILAKTDVDVIEPVGHIDPERDVKAAVTANLKGESRDTSGVDENGMAASDKILPHVSLGG